MRKTFLTLFRFYDRLSALAARGAMAISVVLLAGVTVVTGVAVFFRYVLNDPLQWSQELAQYALVWLVMLGASIAVRSREHIRLDTVVNRIPRKLSASIEMATSFIIIALLSYVIHYSWIMTFVRATRMYSPSLAIKMVWFYSALPFGFALIIFQTIYVVLDDVAVLAGRQDATT